MNTESEQGKHEAQWRKILELADARRTESDQDKREALERKIRELINALRGEREEAQSEVNPWSETPN